MAPILAAVFVGRPETIEDRRGSWRSSIRRKPVFGTVPVTTSGLLGDKVAQPYHGSPGAAVCVHLLDHYRFWESHDNVPLAPGSVGENFTLDGITEDSVCAGDVVRVGSACFQVSGPRVPCANLARHLGRPDWVKRTIEENRTGFYLRVLEAGAVSAGDRWRLEARPNPEATIPALNRCMYLEFDPEFARRSQQMTGLADWWKRQLFEKLSRHADASGKSGHWTETMAHSAEATA